ncbi:uncharacterized protein BDZ99DRAFT_165299 [Mytilinidion resinicola]|uniref:Uncharacterized protein n=1 Tax=Mytilinidion resinicola TaxID=574789 RepID=A0A6A6Y3Q5_9PEZI|nr:uncharacterized protein BDZ99DRAFT_165299 [Mytilinidion resinicola]KAF2803466.1 hypothetical protein BDZ99DRAFT_165299 [Mytilinidion resinicola]
MPFTKQKKTENVSKTIRFAEAPCQLGVPERAVVKQTPGSKTRAADEEEGSSYSPNRSTSLTYPTGRSLFPYPTIPSQISTSPSTVVTLPASRLYSTGASWNPKPAITAFHEPSLAPAATLPDSRNPWDEFYRVRDGRRKKKTTKMRWFGIEP